MSKSKHGISSKAQTLIKTNNRKVPKPLNEQKAFRGLFMYKVKLMIERCAFINQVVFVLNVFL